MIEHRLHRLKSQITQIIVLVSGLSFSRMKLLFKRRFGIPRLIFVVILLSGLVFVLGCEAFVRKFTRKPKKEKMQQEEMVMVPEEYPSLFASKEEEYRQYFLFWQSWQDEFINALLNNKSHKKQMTCLDEAINNLNQVRRLLSEEKQKGLDAYIKRLNDLKTQLSKDLYTVNSSYYRNAAERIRISVSKNFSYSKVKDYIK